MFGPYFMGNEDCECCISCAASFTITSLGGNEYTFTDTSPGSHTRTWTASDGGSSTSSPWTHTFPDDDVYSVTLEIDTGTETCETTKYVGDSVPCSSCNPSDLPQSVYVTLPSVSAGSVSNCSSIRSAVPGTWEIDDPSEAGCEWSNFYTLGTCLTCPNIGATYDHVLGISASIVESGFPVDDITLRVELGCGASPISLDCDSPIYTGGNAVYTKSLGAPPVDCRGLHTLNQISESSYPGEQYIDWPSTVDLLIPTVG